MSIATTTPTDTGQRTASRTTASPTTNPATQTSPNAAQRLRTTMAAVKLAFTWLGVRKTLAPEQRTTAARAFHADRELLSASKLILDTKNPAYRAVAAVRSEASSYWRTVTLTFSKWMSIAGNSASMKPPGGGTRRGSAPTPEKRHSRRGSQAFREPLAGGLGDGSTRLPSRSSAGQCWRTFH